MIGKATQGEYWSVHSRYKATPTETPLERRARRDHEKAVLEAAGFDTEYKFLITDELRARHMVEQIKTATGITLSVGKAQPL